nr:DUF624 domain-containing protein [Brevibacillus sp. SYP-B805]
MLNLLWIAASLPIVTAFAATAAVFAVIRQWLRRKDPGPVMRPFWGFLRENVAASTLGGFALLCAGTIIALLYQAMVQVFSWTALVCLLPAYLIVITGLYLFPAMVHFELTPFGTLRTALLLGITHPLRTLFLLVVLGSFLVVLLLLPGLIPFLSISGGALLTLLIIYPILKKQGE